MPLVVVAGSAIAVGLVVRALVGVHCIDVVAAVVAPNVSAEEASGVVEGSFVFAYRKEEGVQQGM